jgi:hypothetical protein
MLSNKNYVDLQITNNNTNLLATSNTWTGALNTYSNDINSNNLYVQNVAAFLSSTTNNSSSVGGDVSIGGLLTIGKGVSIGTDLYVFGNNYFQSLPYCNALPTVLNQLTPKQYVDTQNVNYSTTTINSILTNSNTYTANNTYSGSNTYSGLNTFSGATNLTNCNTLSLTNNITLNSGTFTTPTSNQLGYITSFALSSSISAISTGVNQTIGSLTLPSGLWLCNWSVGFNNSGLAGTVVSQLCGITNQNNINTYYTVSSPPSTFQLIVSNSTFSAGAV